MVEYLFLVLVCLGGAFVQRVSGFGLGIFSMLFLPYFLPTHTAAAAIISLLSCVTSTYNAVIYRKNIRIKVVIPMLCAALVSIPVAVSFSALVSAEIFRIILGAVLMVLSIYKRLS